MIQFVEQSHRYIDEKGRDLISVSAFTDRFKEKVNWNEIARKCAIKYTRETGVQWTTKAVLAKWARKRDTSANIGTLYHNLRENALLEEPNTVFYNKVVTKIPCNYKEGAKFSIPINEIRNNTVYPELMIYSLEHMLCGQSDKVIVCDNKIHIWDYKTDAEITDKAFSSQWVKPRKLLPPLSHLDDANFNHYAIKMSLYMYMLWKANKGKFMTGDIIIEHVHLRRDPKNDNIAILENGVPVVEKIEQIKLPYLKKEVEAMLKTLKPKDDT